MKKRQIASMVITSAMLFSTVAGVTGCHKKGGSGNGVSKAILNEVQEIEADSLWFDYSEKKLDIVANPDKFDDYYMNDIYPTTDGYVISYQGYNDDGSETHVINMDKDFNVKDDISLSADSFGLREGSECYVNEISVSDGEVFATVSSYFYDEKTYEYESNSFFYNVTKSEVIDVSFLEEKVDKDNSFIENIGIADNGMMFMCVYTYSGNHSGYEILFGKDGKYLKTIDVLKVAGLDEVWGLSYVDSDDDVITFSCQAETSVMFELDTSDWSTEIISSTSMFEGHSSEFTAKDGTLYYMDNDGIYVGEENVMPYSASYVNRNNVNYGTILEADGEHFVITNTFYENGYDTIMVYTFDKADSNPNAGKKILNIGVIEAPYDAACEAVSKFNQANDKYFAQFQIYEIDYSELENSSSHDEKDYENFYLNKSSEMANELTMDLLAGEGPDIILDAASYKQLNTEEYLYDISDIIDEVKDIDVFDNVIEASKVDGKLYNFPLSFSIAGIFAQEKDVKGEKGFTFDEYVEYVDKVCNGQNPMKYMGRTQVLNILLGAMSDEFYDDKGNVSFKNDAFYDLAAYCLDNVPEEYDWGDDDYYYYDGVGVGYSLGEEDSLGFTQLYSIYAYINVSQQYKDDIGFYGIPSNDGRGPSISVDNSVAISAACGDYEGAKEFVKFLFTDDAQSMWEDGYENPIFVDACIELSKKEIAANNRMYDQQLKYASEKELASWGWYRSDESIIDDYIDILKSASAVNSMDPSIFLIVVEEIPYYFDGSKKIEDVAAVIEDRAQTVIDER